jgi:hypothetical protein
MRIDEVANTGHAIGGRRASLPNRAFVAGSAAAIDIGFVLVLHHVVARRHACGQTCIRSAGITRAAHAIAVVLARLPERARITRHTAAIDIAFVLILHAIVTRANRRACAAATIHRRAVAILRTRITQPTRSARRSTAIDAGFVLIFDAIITRRRGNAFG